MASWTQTEVNQERLDVFVTMRPDGMLTLMSDGESGNVASDQMLEINSLCFVAAFDTQRAIHCLSSFTLALTRATHS